MFLHPFFLLLPYERKIKISFEKFCTVNAAPAAKTSKNIFRNYFLFCITFTLSLYVWGAVFLNRCAATHKRAVEFC